MLSGVGVCYMNLKYHIPSKLNIHSFRATIVYTGQPATCWACGQSNHQISTCPTRRNHNMINSEEPLTLNMSNLVSGKMSTTPRYQEPACILDSGNKDKQNKNITTDPSQNNSSDMENCVSAHTSTVPNIHNTIIYKTRFSPI